MRQRSPIPTTVFPFRKSNGLILQRLGEMTGVSMREIAYYKEETKSPPAHLIIQLTKALNISAEELLGIAETENIVDSKLSALWRKLKVLESLSEKTEKLFCSMLMLLLRTEHSKKAT